jgi:hypothetical protein
MLDDAMDKCLREQSKTTSIIVNGVNKSWGETSGKITRNVNKNFRTIIYNSRYHPRESHNLQTDYN